MTARTLSQKVLAVFDPQSVIAANKAVAIAARHDANDRTRGNHEHYNRFEAVFGSTEARIHAVAGLGVGTGRCAFRQPGRTG